MGAAIGRDFSYELLAVLTERMSQSCNTLSPGSSKQAWSFNFARSGTLVGAAGLEPAFL
jgi:hypothetical protein